MDMYAKAWALVQFQPFYSKEGWAIGDVHKQQGHQYNHHNISLSYSLARWHALDMLAYAK